MKSYGVILLLAACTAPIKSSQVQLGGTGGSVSVELEGEAQADPEAAREALSEAARPWAPCMTYTVQIVSVKAKVVPAKGEEPAKVATTILGWFSCSAGAEPQR